jgi:hypothetical protein
MRHTRLLPTILLFLSLSLRPTTAIAEPIYYKVQDAQSFTVRENYVIQLHTRPADITTAIIWIEGTQIRYTLDGTDPILPAGKYLNNLDALLVTRDEARMFRGIKETGFITRMHVLWLNSITITQGD